MNVSFSLSSLTYRGVSAYNTNMVIALKKGWEKAKLARFIQF